MEKFDYNTSDYVTIMGLKNQPKEVKKTILCLPMMPANKESYEAFMAQVEPLGWLVYAIDFRGHGESTNGGKLNWHDFDDEKHKEYKLDAYQAIQKIEPFSKIDTVIGASIGANIALQLQVDCRIPTTVLLSPGLDYWGLATLPFATQVTKDQACLIISSHETNKKGEKLADQAQQIFDALPTGHKTIEIYPGDAHGTKILDEHANRLQKVIDFLSSSLDATAKN